MIVTSIATFTFFKVHAWVNYQSILQKCVVGRLERSINADLYFQSDKDKIGEIRSNIIIYTIKC